MTMLQSGGGTPFSVQVGGKENQCREAFLDQHIWKQNVPLYLKI